MLDKVEVGLPEAAVDTIGGTNKLVGGLDDGVLVAAVVAVEVEAVEVGRVPDLASWNLIALKISQILFLSL